MTIQNGVDIVSVSRIEKSIQNPRFLHNIYSVEEQVYILAKHTPAISAAGHFAAKEAFLKAIGTGIRSTDLNKIGISHDSHGAPYFVLEGWATTLLSGRKIALSISHTSRDAIAFVTVYKED